MRFSASRLKTFQDCQQKGKFKYVDMLPDEGQNAKASFGTVMHHCLELYNQTANIELAIEQFKDLWQNPEKLGVAPTMWPKYTTYGGLRERGIVALKNYAGVVDWDKREVIATEHEFTVPFGKHELHGFVDLLDVRKSGRGISLLRVTDYKTNSKKPNKAELFLDIQFSIYMYASLQKEFWVGIPNGEDLFEKLKDVKRRAIWFQLWDGLEIDAGPRDEDDFGRLYRLCESVQSAYDKDVFVPRIGEACLYCPFTKECGDFTIPDEAEIRSQEDAWI